MGDATRKPLAVTVEAIEKGFGRFPALNGVGLDVRPGELLALLGPSGSGKTTLLRVIAGLEFPDRGRVLYDGEDVTDTPTSARRIGFVFQQYALFKHMTVAKNVAFGLEVRKAAARPDRAARTARVEALLGMVELAGYGDRYPTQLSGGQRQRVSLARALASAPRLLLLDEPFGALDAAVRKALRRELRRIHDATGVTTIFVTHDQEEALELADRVAILNRGRIEQIGTPDEVQDRPASAFVAGFIGELNRIEGEVRAGMFQAGPISIPAAGVADGAAAAFVAPHHIALANTSGPGFTVKLERLAPHGPICRLECVTPDGRRLDVSVDRRIAAERLTAGEVICLAVAEGQVFSA